MYHPQERIWRKGINKQTYLFQGVYILYYFGYFFLGRHVPFGSVQCTHSTRISIEHKGGSKFCKQVLASYRGARNYFSVLICCQIILYIVPFPLSIVQLMGEFCDSRWSTPSTVLHINYLIFPLCVLRQYMYSWRSHTYSAFRRSAANK